MRPKLLIVLSFFAAFLYCSSSAKAQSCCPLPDSLMVTSVTDSSFCVKWHVTDTLNCDSLAGAILVYKPNGAANWTSVKIKYLPGQHSFTFCDTLSPCLRYQWRIRNVCISNGDTTLTDYVKGPNFDSGCDSFARHTPVPGALQIAPNPARSSIMLKGSFPKTTTVTVVITNQQGIMQIRKNVAIVGGSLQQSLDVSALNPGVYFVSVLNGKTVVKQNFIKQ